MESFSAGWLSLVPPVIAIILALVSKEVISSLLVGIFSGTLIYAIGTGADNILMTTVEAGFKEMVNKVDFNIIVFCSLLGALVYTITLAGGSRAYGRWAGKRITSRRSALMATGGLGILIFIDDYFNCLTIGTAMRPVTDTYKVARAKLAYIVDSMAAPVCIIAPISSWAAAVGSSLKSTGAFESDFGAFVATIPYNFYALSCIAMVFFIIWTGFDFGPMRKAEERAAAGDLGAVDAHDEGVEVSKKGTIWDMVIPLIALIIFSTLSLLYSGGYWGSDPAYHSIAAALGNCSASNALVWGSFGALCVAFVLFVSRGVVGYHRFMDGCIEGIKTMLPANIILVLAWTISGVCRDLLQTPEFVQSVVSAGHIAAFFLPAGIFLVACFLAFSIGTAWGTCGILIPIVVSVAQSLAPELMLASLSASLAGSVFGDHCSPISDTTILSSAGSGCSHIEHVYTQIPYALVSGAAALAGFVVTGLTGGSAWPGLAASIVTLVVLVCVLHFGPMRNRAKA